MVAIDEFRSYFNSMDGSATWESVKPHFDAVFHDDLVVVTVNGEVDKAGWAGAVKGLIAAGVTTSDLDMHSDAEGAIHYSLTLTKNDGSAIKVASTATIKDGKVVHVEPLDPEKYTQMAATARA